MPPWGASWPMHCAVRAGTQQRRPKSPSGVQIQTGSCVPPAVPCPLSVGASWAQRAGFARMYSRIRSSSSRQPRCKSDRCSQTADRRQWPAVCPSHTIKFSKNAILPRPGFNNSHVLGECARQAARAGLRAVAFRGCFNPANDFNFCMANVVNSRRLDFAGVLPPAPSSFSREELVGRTSVPGLLWGRRSRAPWRDRSGAPAPGG